MSDIYSYRPLEQDYRFWLVVNPAKWLLPIFVAVVLVAVAIHGYAFSLPGKSWTLKKHHVHHGRVVAPRAPAAPAAK
jgi:hypothetical protein